MHCLTFVEILEYVAGIKGSEVVKVDRFYPSSKVCSECDTINENLELKDRTWICSHCNTTQDLNAAINIQRVGASTLGLGNVRPANTEAVSV
ncbi:zinc ribbon domain-containing protein [Natranaerobius trueperi]|uniref:zinc ribbon domain-containing protein n=1 Tax=Natranaerobius trueperi TaxID=759412 RepID=UPI0013033161|nr:zinc ribbon domain-containing protein [Natranaerobius trueperi]